MSRQRPMEVIEKAEYVTIGELARLTDVRYSTLKFYTEEGMLPFYQAEENLTRRYRREESVRRILGIKELRRQGLSIPQVFIPKLLSYYRQGKFPFDRLIKFYDFQDINQAFADTKSGAVIKAVLRMP